eukprot:scaffold19071_cov70-Phaeocystis_antarctica.AAC.1
MTSGSSIPTPTMTTSVPTIHHTTAIWCMRRRANPKPSAVTPTLTPTLTSTLTLTLTLVLTQRLTRFPQPWPHNPYSDPSPDPNLPVGPDRRLRERLGRDGARQDRPRPEGDGGGAQAHGA